MAGEEAQELPVALGEGDPRVFGVHVNHAHEAVPIEQRLRHDGRDPRAREDLGRRPGPVPIVVDDQALAAFRDLPGHPLPELQAELLPILLVQHRVGNEQLGGLVPETDATPTVPHQLAESPADKVQHRPEIQLAGDLLADGPDGLELLGAGPQLLLRLLAGGHVVQGAMHGQESSTGAPDLPPDGGDPDPGAVFADRLPFSEATGLLPRVRTAFPAPLYRWRYEKIAEEPAPYLLGLVTKQGSPGGVDGDEAAVRVENLIGKGDVVQMQRNMGRVGAWPVARGVGVLRPMRGGIGHRALLASALQWLRPCARHAFPVRGCRDQYRKAFRSSPANPNRRQPGQSREQSGLRPNRTPELDISGNGGCLALSSRRRPGSEARTHHVT
jgi:hypothetical protein